MNAKQIVAGSIAALTLGFSVASYAHPGGGFGPGTMGGKHGMGSGSPRAGFAGPMGGQHLMTTEERTVTAEKMRAAKTPEERQQIAQTTHAEMHKRAESKGITLPEHRGPRFGATPQVPSTTEHSH